MLRSTLTLSICLLVVGCGLAAPFSGSPSSRLVARASETLDPKFFARRDVQALMPEAFTLTPQSQPILRAIQTESEPKRHALIKALRSDNALYLGIRGYDKLAQSEQLTLLQRVFDVECRVLGITPPELVFDKTLKGPAYFDFDPTRPGTGRVLLNPDELAKESNPYAGLLLLVHETRHSAQFQMAFGSGSSALPVTGYRSAFEAQKKLSKQLNFCDFCSLHNEHEAFQFANYVIGALTDWRVDTRDMGCFSSQYDAQGKLKIDLVTLASEVGSTRLLDAFNEREKEQYKLLFGKP